MLFVGAKAALAQRPPEPRSGVHPQENAVEWKNAKLAVRGYGRSGCELKGQNKPIFVQRNQ